MKSFFHALLVAASFAVACPLHADEHDLEVLRVRPELANTVPTQE